MLYASLRKVFTDNYKGKMKSKRKHYKTKFSPERIGYGLYFNGKFQKFIDYDFNLVEPISLTIESIHQCLKFDDKGQAYPVLVLGSFEWERAKEITGFYKEKFIEVQK